MRCICLLNNTYIMSTVLDNPHISSKVLLSKKKSLELTNTAVFLLRDSVMITQNVTLSNAQGGRYKRWNKMFNPGLALIGFSGTGTRTFLLTFVLFNFPDVQSHGGQTSIDPAFTPDINEVQAGVKVHLEFCCRLITLTPKTLFPKCRQYRNFLSQPSLRTADVFPVVASLPPKHNVCEPERQNNIREVKAFVSSLANQIKGQNTARVTPRDIARWRVLDFSESYQIRFGT